MAKQLDYHTIREIFTRFQEADPEPKGELEHVNVYTLVVAVALSAQATDAGVNKATRALFKIADTPQKMLDLGEEGLIEHIKTIGLFRQKAKNVIKLSRILVEDYDGKVPNSRAALQSLPGVGRQTAHVVLNMWWRQPAQAVDTHIFRVGNRTGICPGKDVDAVERAIIAVIHVHTLARTVQVQPPPADGGCANGCAVLCDTVPQAGVVGFSSRAKVPQTDYVGQIRIVKIPCHHILLCGASDTKPLNRGNLQVNQGSMTDSSLATAPTAPRPSGESDPCRQADKSATANQGSHGALPSQTAWQPLREHTSPRIRSDAVFVRSPP